ncbi:hypothetical protein F4781DRAFT_434785 [Annulohypoxylon bovei var. microspora]|nr:hypothetical protein F4781DRAFT_434785 [Annulohypoxylon bovei var. microspora]
MPNDLKNIKTIKWAFYKNDHFENFNTDMTALINELENIFSSEPDLEELKDMVEHFDPELEVAADERLGAMSNMGTYITQPHITGMATWIYHGDIGGVGNGDNN